MGGPRRKLALWRRDHRTEGVVGVDACPAASGFGVSVDSVDVGLAGVLERCGAVSDCPRRLVDVDVGALPRGPEESDADRDAPPIVEPVIGGGSIARRESLTNDLGART